MAINYQGLPPLAPVPGIGWGVASAGIKTPGRRDLAVMAIDEGATVAGVFTRNAFCAAPVQVCRRHLSKDTPRYLVVNTGNANAGTGEQGLADALDVCATLAAAAGCRPEQVLPFSTGVIGEYLPMGKLRPAIATAQAAVKAGWEEAAEAIMTTDTVAKGDSVQLSIDGRPVTITGIAKGAGMIRPDMATMLAFVATDARIEASLLQQLLNEMVTDSFNSITVDGDTSTNDSLILVATGYSGVEPAPGSEDLDTLRTALRQLCIRLAQLIIRDAEGVSKFITICVEGGIDEDECRQVAFTVAHSPLVKTAFFASDPNWGRILATVGRAGIVDLELDRIDIDLDEVRIVSAGDRDRDYTEQRGQMVMDRDEITVRIALGRGEAEHTIWTSDLSLDYVRINAEYRT